jgi:hypothetical protein
VIFTHPMSLAGHTTAVLGLHTGIPSPTATTVEVLAEGIPADAAVASARLSTAKTEIKGVLILLYLRLGYPFPKFPVLDTHLPSANYNSWIHIAYNAILKHTTN